MLSILSGYTGNWFIDGDFRRVQVDGCIRLSKNPFLSDLDEATDTLEKGDVVSGFEVVCEENGKRWFYIPEMDRFIWYGRKIRPYMS